MKKVPGTFSIDRLVEAIENAGVEGWSVYGSESRRLSLGIKDGQRGGVHSPLAVSEAAGARYLIVWSDGRISRGMLERRDVEREPEAALARAREASYDDPDAAAIGGPADFPQVELHAPEAARQAGGETGCWVRRLAAVRERFEDGGFRTWSGSFSASEGRAHLRTSAGLDVRGGGTGCGWYVSFDGELGDGWSARAPDDDDAFERRLDRLVETVRALARDADPPAAGERPLLLHPDVVERYVLGVLLHNLDGSTVADDEGRFGRGAFGSGEPVLREDLTLRLDPLIPLRGGSYRFTSEGVPAARCTYLERGRLVSPVLDRKYARRLGREPTPVPFGMDTLFLEGREPLSRDEAFARGAGGALVLSVLGVHTQDFASGDFSLSAPQALALDGVGYGGRLRCTISGNLFDLLTDDRTELVRFPDEHVPGLLVHARMDPK